MGKWMNVCFVRTDDVERLETEVRRLLEATGRRLVRARPRTPEPYDPMQYGHGDEAPRWGVAGFPAAPGWCALRTAPFELLIDASSRLLSRLTQQLGTTAFQHNLYDGGGELLVEADARGAFERWGMGTYGTWERVWGREEPSEDRLHARFHVVDPRPAARLARERWPELRVSEVMAGTFKPRPGAREAMLAKLPPELRAKAEAQDALRASQRPPPPDPAKLQREQALRTWLASVGAEVVTRHGPGGSLDEWTAHPSDVVLAMAGGADASFLGGDVRTEAVRLVFGGEAAEHCDNTFLVETLVPHAPLPVERGFVLYADRA